MDAREAIDRVLKALGTESAAGTSSEDPASAGREVSSEPLTDKPVANALGLFDMVKAAIDRYRTTVTWIVGSYAAIWVVLAGTAPFAGLGDLEAASKIVAGAGLLIAGLGALLGIYAASRVLEPEDSSLGELKGRLTQEEPGAPVDLSRNPKSWKPFERLRRYFTVAPVWDAERRMRALFDAESSAYFGTDQGGAAAAEALIKDLDEKSSALTEKRVAAARAALDAVDAAIREREAARIVYEESLDRRERTLAVAVAYEVRGKYSSTRRLLLGGAVIVLLGTLLYLGQVVTSMQGEEEATEGSGEEQGTSL